MSWQRVIIHICTCSARTNIERDAVGVHHMYMHKLYGMMANRMTNSLWINAFRKEKDPPNSSTLTHTHTYRRRWGEPTWMSQMAFMTLLLFAPSLARTLTILVFGPVATLLWAYSRTLNKHVGPNFFPVIQPNPSSFNGPMFALHWTIKSLLVSIERFFVFCEW